MKEITIQHKFAGKFKGLLQFQNATQIAVIVLERLSFKGRDGKLQVYPRSTTFTMLRADVNSKEIGANKSPLSDDAESCPECGTQMKIETFPTGDESRLRTEATCPGCGYTQA